jgi:hypothetical protein
LSDLEALVTGSTLLGGRLIPHPEIKGAYQLKLHKIPVDVTFKPEVFDQHPSTVRLLSFGDKVLDELLRGIPPPVPSQVEDGILRLLTDVPVPLRAYFAAQSQRSGSLDDLEALQTALSTDSAVAGTANVHIDEAERIFQASIKRTLTNVESTNLHRTEAHTRAVHERARLLLLRAAMIELAIAEQPDLLSEQGVPFEFSEEAVLRLGRRGYPFSGLLRSVDMLGLRPSPADPFFADVRSESREVLRRRFEEIRKRGGEILREVVATAKGASRVPGAATAVVSREFLLWPVGRPLDR